VKTKTIFWIVGVVLLLLGGLFVASYMYNPSDEEKLYQCNDGIDNDGDNLIDYREGTGDTDCKSDTDRFEKKMPSIYWLVIPLCVGLVIFISYMIYKNWKSVDKEQELKPEPVLPARAWDLALSNMLKERFSKIDTYFIPEKDGTYIEKPCDMDIVLWKDREIHVHPRTGNAFQYDFFEVKHGEYAGTYQTTTPVSWGEKVIKGGVQRFRRVAGLEYYSRKSLTYNLDTPINEQMRLKYTIFEAGQDGDTESVAKATALLEALNGSTSSVGDEDDKERLERLRIQNMNKTKKKTTTAKDRKASTGSTQQQMQPQSYNDDGGDDE
jgi:hypothetical protein